MKQTDNLRVRETTPLPSPQALKADLPQSAAVANFVRDARRDVEAVLADRDPRLLVIVGPCSIHDVAAAREYAHRLLPLRNRLADRLLICMRVFFEKPRTSVGWKGLINDPHLDGSQDVEAGLRLSRSLLLELGELGLPAATEMLDPVTPQYLADSISWTAIGARTTESQTHREMASGLSMPVGFKNGTDGALDIAINAMKAARAPHSFIGIDPEGRVSIVRSAGNPACHAVLRGGRDKPNYDRAAVEAAAAQLAANGLPARVLVDCSHANSGKRHEGQSVVLEDVALQLASGSPHVLGVMLESHLVAGRQDLAPGQPLRYGQSITDACIDFATTERLLQRLAQAVSFPARSPARPRPRRSPDAAIHGGFRPQHSSGLSAERRRL